MCSLPSLRDKLNSLRNLYEDGEQAESKRSSACLNTNMDGIMTEVLSPRLVKLGCLVTRHHWGLDI